MNIRHRTTPHKPPLASAQNGSKAFTFRTSFDRKYDCLLGTPDEDIPTPEEATERWEAFQGTDLEAAE